MTVEQNEAVACKAVLPPQTILGHNNNNIEKQDLPEPMSTKAQPASALNAPAWDYESSGECGPHNWMVHCTDGAKGTFCTLVEKLNQQSPIDLTLPKCVAVPGVDSLKFVNYETEISGKMVHTGHSVQFLPDARIDAPEIYGGELDQHYRFIQYHYHWSQNDSNGSEHSLDGKFFPAELHLVHQGVDDPSKLAVLGIFLQLPTTPENEVSAEALKPDAEALPHILQFPQKTLCPKQKLQSKLPKSTTCFCRYQGSLTTPPCTENVTWTVFTEPVTITREQLSILRSVRDFRGQLVQCNCRPVQSLNGRSVLACEGH
jgi:carbonic anhydrase